MKKRNGFFSFSIVTVALLALSLSLTAASLAWKHFQMARTYEETVRLTYLAEVPSMKAGTSSAGIPMISSREGLSPCRRQKAWLLRENSFPCAAGISRPVQWPVVS